MILRCTPALCASCNDYDKCFQSETFQCYWQREQNHLNYWENKGVGLWQFGLCFLHPCIYWQLAITPITSSKPYCNCAQCYRYHWTAIMPYFFLWVFSDCVEYSTGANRGWTRPLIFTAWWDEKSYLETKGYPKWYSWFTWREPVRCYSVIILHQRFGIMAYLKDCLIQTI